MVTALLVGTLLAAPAVDWNQFLTRLENTDSQDPRALLRLGEWCERQRQPSWASKCYRMVLKLGDGNRTEYEAASFRLAKIDLKRRRYDEAYARLHELVGKYKNEDARQLLQTTQSQSARQQLKFIAAGDREVQREKYASALATYEKAYKLVPKEETGTAYVPRRVILKKLSEARKKYDDEYYDQRVKSARRHIRPCDDCNHAGFRRCQTCNGSKRVREAYYVRTVRGLRKQYRYVPCKTCKALGYQGCGVCMTVGVLAPITDKERKVLAKVIQRVTSVKLMRAPLRDAMEEIEETLLEITQSASLNYFRSIRPKYRISSRLQRVIDNIPATSEELNAATSAWNDLRRKKDIQSRIRFLLGYSCGYARYVLRFDMLRRSKQPSLSRLAKQSSEPEEILSPELLSAFPDSASTRWITVSGFMKDYDREKKQYKGRLEVKAEIDHDVNFYVWLPRAEEALDRLADGGWKKRLGSLVKKYPYDLDAKLDAVPKDRQVTLVGRFLRDRLSSQRNWFEVWNVHVGLSRKQAQIYDRLSERIEQISFPNMSVRDVARVLGKWFDVKIEFDGVTDRKTINCTATDCTVGSLMEAIARKALRADWYYDDGKFIICRRAPSKQKRDLVEVMKKIRDAGSGEVAFAKSERKAVAAAIPDDPAGLRVLASMAGEKMDYATVRKCFVSLGQHSSGGKRRDQVDRLQSKFELFGALTDGTPVSHLVGAKTLARVAYQKPSGDVETATVRIIKRDAKNLTIQLAYGAQFPLAVGAIREEKALSASRWHDDKKAELQKRESALGDLPPRERVNALFLLSLYAKTHKFLDRGTRYLEDAIREDDFEWVLSTYFPRQQSRLVTAWKRATFRDLIEIEAPAEEEMIDEPDAGAIAGTPEKLDDDVNLTDVGPVPDDQSEYLSYIKKCMRRGGECLGRALRGENAAGWRKRALAYYRRAETTTDRWLDAEPNNPEVGRLRGDVAQRIQICVKDLGFFD